jgi:hypothetical protein
MTTRLTFLRSRAARCVAALALALHAGGAARATDSLVYKCVDAQGRILFTDTAGRGCTMLELPGVFAAPAPRRGGAAPRAPRAAAPAPANFPRVDTAVQRVRDDDRRAILETELRSEESKLGELKREFNQGEPERLPTERGGTKYQERVSLMRDNLGRAERNIAALKRELANIR